MKINLNGREVKLNFWTEYRLVVKPEFNVPKCIARSAEFQMLLENKKYKQIRSYLNDTYVQLSLEDYIFYYTFYDKATLNINDLQNYSFKKGKELALHNLIKNNRDELLKRFTDLELEELYEIFLTKIHG